MPLTPTMPGHHCTRGWMVMIDVYGDALWRRCPECNAKGQRDGEAKENIFPERKAEWERTGFHQGEKRHEM